MASSRGTRRTPATEVRTNLIASGRRILERDGVAGLTVRAVATDAGVAPMGVYNHFDGKEGLLDGLVSDAFVEFARMIDVTDDDARERLAHSGRAYREFARRYPVAYSLMFSREHHPDSDVADHAFAVLTDHIRYGQNAGLLMKIDPYQATMQVWSCVHGAVSLELAGTHPPTIDPTENYEHVLAMVVRGLSS
ncbi:TetR/AcrR family transcriptional regulator [Gordonia sp. 852002-10350_SCH5691597]|uniref:TetR/AcrR family transcriptional regulator n=1 Tax=Gordonia sp. 852002-10350_SCH5691597 TaxID=1834085 RepID=UPI0007EABB83|nr:TetR/AcrR family transcriptional regulator [Gordonia sp. 852002-10350_SCH5691597]OBA62054.1 TetR family transcriptional regulator [Gordonia sp. 852002-10350_SCH5691597]